MVEVLATVPTSGRRSIDLMMPVWSPGYYRVEDYAANVRELKATNEYLASLSSLIGNLQNAPGRLLQSVEQSSLGVWNNSNSGVSPNASTVSYSIAGNRKLDVRADQTEAQRRNLTVWLERSGR